MVKYWFFEALLFILFFPIILLGFLWACAKGSFLAGEDAARVFAEWVCRED